MSTIEAIENDVWPDPGPDASSMVKRIHGLRTLPVAELEADDLRVLLSQNVGVAAVLPEALRRLETHPLLEGDYFPGDVLTAVLRLSKEYWAAHPAEKVTVQSILERLDPADPEYPEGTDLPSLVAAFA